MIVEMDFPTAWALQKTEKAVFIDVRSEKEYALDHIPNAINIPILNDAIREKTGTLYKQAGHEEARIYALREVAPLLPALLEQILHLSKEAKIILYCWRGGMRSQAMAAFLNIMHLPAIRLNRGYKGYREHIRSFWEQPFPLPIAVLHGFTGIGKTRIINAFAALPNAENQAIDLEGLAGHRGSAFGAIGLPVQPSQKMFESLLWQAVQNFTNNKPVLVECESKRIGRLFLPDTLCEAMRNGIAIFAEDTQANRVEKILQDYEPEKQITAIIQAIGRLKDRLGREQVAELTQSIEKGMYKPVVAMLLKEYYDPLYKHTKQKENHYDLKVNAADCDAAARVISEFLVNR